MKIISTHSIPFPPHKRGVTVTSQQFLILIGLTPGAEDFNQYQALFEKCLWWVQMRLPFTATKSESSYEFGGKKLMGLLGETIVSKAIVELKAHLLVVSPKKLNFWATLKRWLKARAIDARRQYKADNGILSLDGNHDGIAPLLPPSRTGCALLRRGDTPDLEELTEIELEVRQKDILYSLAEGYTWSEIEAKLHVSPRDITAACLKGRAALGMPLRDKSRVPARSCTPTTAGD